MPFQLESNFKPRGDQGQAVAKLLKSVEAGNRHQTLLGVTGSGKTFTVANVISGEAVLGRLIDMLYERNDVNFARGRFRVSGDVVEVYPATADEEGIRLEFFGDEIDAIRRFDPLTGHTHESLNFITFFPAN